MWCQRTWPKPWRKDVNAKAGKVLPLVAHSVQRPARGSRVVRVCECREGGEERRASDPNQGPVLGRWQALQVGSGCRMGLGWRPGDRLAQPSPATVCPFSCWQQVTETLCFCSAAVQPPETFLGCQEAAVWWLPRQ